MECLIYRRGKAVGTLKIEEDGLYRVLTACIPLYREILRLYVPEAMGVFVPEDGSLICRRRISRAKLPTLPQFACAWCEKDSLWSAESKGLRRRWHPQGIELAIRWQTEAPMHFPAAPDRLKPVLIGNTAYLSYLQPYADQ